MTPKDWPRAIITVAVLALFSFAFAMNPADEMMKGSLIAAFAAATQYWLGSSKGSSDKSDQLERQATETQEVTVTNEDDDPVPTTSERRGRG